jgi:protein-tyrosine phosphatase
MRGDQMKLYMLPVAEGELAISALPGATGDYATDLADIVHWKPDLVISLTQISEMQATGAVDLGKDLKRQGISWRLAAIPDFGTPALDFMSDWPALSERACASLGHNGRVLVHCRGGCGRSGMIALRLMVLSGEDPQKALKRLRAVRSCAIETAAQMKWAFDD